MKKLFQSKGFIVTSLCVLCVGILAACFLLGRDQGGEFVPDTPPASSAASDWTENPSGSGGRAEDYDVGKTPEVQEQYPKVVDESEQEVVIDFTPSEKPEVTPPPAPEGKTAKEDVADDHPQNISPEVTPPPSEPSSPSQPQPGSSNGNGAVYDPVFGWVVPGEVHQSTIDNDGDPNKMVGQMD